MLSSLNFIIAFLWFASALADYLEFCYLWQLKEYRWDRFRDFLSTHQGKTYWLTYSVFWRSLVAIVLFFWPFNDVPTIKLACMIIFGIDAIRSAAKVLRRQLRHPKLTLKAMVILAASLGAEALLIVAARDWALVFLLLIARFFIISGIVILIRFPTQTIKQWRIRMAGRTLLQYPRLRIIGITGSYGKTTVKTFLTHILKGKYNVISTPKHVNTDIGVAGFILATDFSHVDFFVVEMGAYGAGEIKAICDIVRPEIGILTAVSEQHISLFGSIQAIRQTKYELLHALPETGFAVTNADNQYCREYIHALWAPVATFGYDEEYHPTIRIVQADTKIDRMTATYLWDDETVTITAPIPGAHNAANIAPCLLVARWLDMTIADIQKQCETLSLPEHTLGIFRYGAATVIDDSYNANTDGFKSALHYLAGFPASQKKIVITRGIPELGQVSANVHEMIGGELSFAADEVVVITADFFEDIRRGIGEKYRTTIVLKENHDVLLTYMRTLKDTPCVILLENRMPPAIMRELCK